MTSNASWSSATGPGSGVSPAGAIEPGEKPRDAVERETLEETGLRVAAGRVLAVAGGPLSRVTYPNGDQVEYVVTIFECEARGGTLLTDFRTHDETTALRWAPLDGLPTFAFPYPREVFFPRPGGT